MTDRLYTTKQMGDAGEMLVAAELTLAGIPALTVPDNWPHYDIIAQPPPDWSGCSTPLPQRISVKTRTFSDDDRTISYNSTDEFDWLAIVILKQESKSRSIFIVPSEIAEERCYKTSGSHRNRRFVIRKLSELLGSYEGNFSLNRRPVQTRA